MNLLLKKLKGVWHCRLWGLVTVCSHQDKYVNDRFPLFPVKLICILSWFCFLRPLTFLFFSIIFKGLSSPKEL